MKTLVRHVNLTAMNLESLDSVFLCFHVSVGVFGGVGPL